MALSNEIEYALWFHDAVYDPRAKDNEERSADLAAATALEAGGSRDFAASVRALVLATRHTAAPSGAGEPLIVDIDLAILGQSEAAFDEYERAIRKEYEWVAERTFREGRSAVLRSFLERPAIYSTRFFRAKYEAAARANLARSIERLRTL